MRILVAGGGIGGLAVASLLKKYGFEVLLIERAHKWKNIGYIVYIYPNGRNILKELGLYDFVGEIGQEVNYDYVFDKKGSKIKKIDVSEITKKFGPILGVERSKIHHALRNLLGNISTKLDTTIEKLTQYSTHVDVKFSDGSWDKFDIVIGSDGAHSELRDEVFGKNKLEYYNWAVWLTWIKENYKIPQGAIMMLGEGKGFMIYQAPNQKICGLFLLPAHHGTPEKIEERTKLLKEKFGDFGWFVPKILNSLDNPMLIYHDDLTKVNMHKWYKNRVVLIGDAEHALSPLLGMGCSMALEDAYVLAHELKNADPNNVIEAFKKFSLRRQGRIEMLQKEERKLWSLINIKSTFLSKLRNLFVSVVPQSFFTGGFYKIVSHKI